VQWEVSGISSIVVVVDDARSLQNKKKQTKKWGGETVELSHDTKVPVGDGV
jgi:hypothetical protein